MMLQSQKLRLILISKRTFDVFLYFFRSVVDHTLYDLRFKAVHALTLLVLITQPSCELVMGPDLPSDSQLEKVFRENRDDFEKLVRMSDEDSHMSVIRYGFTVVEGKGSSTDTGQLGFSTERWQEYKSLFTKVGLEDGIGRAKGGSVHFDAYSWGLATGGTTKGYIYSKDETPKGNFTCTDDSLDVPAPVYDVAFVCKNLDTNWYLFVSR